MKDYSNARVCEVIDDRIHSARDREILKRRLVDGVGIECLAEEFEKSTSQIKRILYHGKEIVFRYI